MRKLLKTNIHDIKILSILLFIYLLTRLYNLTVLPIFTDESIYIYWGKLIATSASYWFISVTDGKPPLLIWMMLPFLKLLPAGNYLIAGRLPSVISGFFAVIAMYLLARTLFDSRKSAILAATLYITIPFFLIYDRMALFDSLLTSTLLWTTFFAIKTVKTWSVKYAILWGIALGFSFLSKATAITFMGLLPLVLVVLTPYNILRIRWKQLVLFSFIATVVGETINNIQRISKAYYLTPLKNAQFQIPLGDLLSNPFQLTFSNLHAFGSWFLPYVTLPIFILGIISFIFLFLKKPRIGVSLFILFIVPTITLATVGRIIFPRYFLFITPYFILPIAFCVSFLFEKNKKLSILIVGGFLILLFPALRFDYYAMVNPIFAPFPKTDRDQYVVDHSSGYGLNTVFSYINNKKKNQSITLVTQGTFGIYPYAFNLEYWNDPKVNILPRWPLSSLDQEILNIGKSKEVYIVIKEQKKVSENFPVDIVATGYKPDDKYRVILTKLNKQ